MPITAAAIWRVHHHAQRRHLFNLPNLSSFTPSLPGNLEPQTYHERKILPYTRRQLYAVVSDVGSYASFVPFCTHSRIVRPLAPTPTPTTPNAQQMEAELTVAFLALTERYTSRVTCVPYESVKAVAETATPLFKALETTWRFHPASSASSSLHESNGHPAPSTPSRSQQGKEMRSFASAADDVGPTVVSLDLSFAFANPVHAAVSGAFFGKVSGLMVRAFEERCSKVYGPSRREGVE